MFAALNSALSGIRQSVAGLYEAAQRIAAYGERADRAAEGGAEGAAPSAENDLARDIVELRQHETSVKANAAVVRSADRTLGTQLDLVG
jgi:hypothetical protein